MTIKLEEAIISALIATEGKSFLSHDLTADLFTGMREDAFRAMENQFRERGGFDLVTLEYEIGRAKDLSELAASFASESQIQHYANEIRKEKLKHAIEGVRAWAVSQIEVGHDILAISAQATEKMESLRRKWGQMRKFNELESAFNDILVSLTKQKPAKALLFGFSPIDDLTDGMLPGDNAILAARPSIGKTAFILGLLAGLAKRQIKTTFFSCEMGALALAGRILAQESMRSSRKAIRRPESITQDEAAYFLSVAPKLEDIARYLTVVSTIGNSWQAIYSRARQEVKDGAKLIACDYLQLLTEGDRNDNRNQEVERISRSWKMLLRSAEVPGIMLSQLSRKCEEERRLPVLSDLRDSGSIEQDADLVWFLAQEYPKAKGAMPEKEKVILFQAKGRDHGTGFKSLRFRPEIQTFYPMENRGDG